MLSKCPKITPKVTTTVFRERLKEIHTCPVTEKWVRGVISLVVLEKTTATDLIESLAQTILKYHGGIK